MISKFNFCKFSSWIFFWLTRTFFSIEQFSKQNTISVFFFWLHSERVKKLEAIVTRANNSCQIINFEFCSPIVHLPLWQAILLFTFISLLGTSINDVRRFWPIFDLPTYLCPIWSDFAWPTYLMTSDFEKPTFPPNFFNGPDMY